MVVGDADKLRVGVEVLGVFGDVDFGDGGRDGRRLRELLALRFGGGERRVFDGGEERVRVRVFVRVVLVVARAVRVLFAHLVGDLAEVYEVVGHVNQLRRAVRAEARDLDAAAL